MKSSYSANKISIGGKVITFYSPIKDVLEINDIVLVLLQRVGIKLDSNDSMNRNIYAFGMEGNELWQIQESPSGGNIDKPYTAIYTNSNKVIAYNGLGYEYELNLQEGKVEPTGGRPW